MSEAVTRRRRSACFMVAVSGALVIVTGCGSSSKSPNTATSSGGGGFFGSTAASSAADGAPSSAASASSGGTGALPSACSLLTQTEAEALAGTKLNAPVPAGAAGSGEVTLCQFTGPTTGPTAQVEVFVGDGVKKQLDIDRDNLKHAFTSVPGIGDQCLQEDDNIFVQKNGIWASINLVLLNDPAQNVQPMQTAIKQIAGRLP